MNIENFSEYLENPYLLYQLSYEELKSLVLQYPYASNLHMLLLEKSRLDRHKDYEKNLARAATYTYDRSYLYQKIHSEALQPVEKAQLILDEEVLELKDLTSLQDQLEKIPLMDTPPSDPEEIRQKLVPDRPLAPFDDSEISLDFSLDAEEPAGSHSPDTGEMEGEEDLGEPARPVAEHKTATAVPDEQLEAPTSSSQSQEVEVAVEESPTFQVDEVMVADLVAFRQMLDVPEESVPTPVAEIAVTPVPHFLAMDHIMADAAALTSCLSSLPVKPLRKKSVSLPLEIVQTPKETETDEIPYTPMPKAQFSSWSKRLKPAIKIDKPLRMRSVTPSVNHEHLQTADPPESDIKKIAARSVKDHREIASETLAELLVQQELYRKAIKMYERLSLKFPEKNAFFAEKIKELKKF